MTADQNERLKALALAAPEGPWTWGSKYVAKPAHGTYSHIAQCPDGEEDTPAWEAKAAYIAAANPAAVLELCNENTELRAEVERLRARFEYIEDRATTVGGGNGFKVTFFVPVDHEDIGCGIDAAIEKEKA